MNILDVALVVVLVAAAVAGLARGFVASVGSLVGVVAAGAAALWLAPFAARLVPAPEWRVLTAILVWVVLIVVGAALGGAVGAWVRRGVDRTPLRVVDRLFGGVAAVVIAAVVLSFAAAATVAAGIPSFSATVASSRVIQGIDALVPTWAQRMLAEARGTLAADGLPAVAALLTGGPVPVHEAPLSLDGAGVTAAAQSVARITGVAYACGTSLTGSGFAVTGDAVVTNAHVVAGVDRPLVQLPDGATREGHVVYFDPTQDLAVIDAPGLGATALHLAGTLPVGTSAVIAGYPYGGPLSLGDARITSSGVVPMPDIYGDAVGARPVLGLAAAVRPGNSGGPVLTAQGTVAGVVFARIEGQADRGYAIGEPALASVVSRIGTFGSTVPTGHCAP